MKNIYYLCIVSFLLAACQKSSVDKKEEGLIRYKETVQINDVPSATLTFFDVEDSRCPEGANCIVAGFVQVNIALDGVTTSGKITNHLKMCVGCGDVVPDSLDYKFAGFEYRLILKSVTPLTPKIETKKTDYAISLDIKKI